MIEEWRPVVGYEGRYEVSNYGAIRTLLRNTRTDENGDRTNVLLPDRHWRGYLRIRLYHASGKRNWVRVHTAVAVAFIGPKPRRHRNEGDFTVDHLDEDKTNNVSLNLEWVTRIENHRRHYERTRATFVEVE